MSTISYNRVVNVVVNVNDRFPTVANFSIPVILTEVAEAGIDTDIVQSHGSLDTLAAAGYPTDSLVYLQAAAMLATARAPRTFKVAYLDTSDVAASMAAIKAVDTGFYVMVLARAATVADVAILTALNQFAAIERKVLFFDCEDTALRDGGQSPDALAFNLRQIQPSRMAEFYRDPFAGDLNGVRPLTASLTVYTAIDDTLGDIILDDGTGNDSLAIQPNTSYVVALPPGIEAAPSFQVIIDFNNGVSVPLSFDSAGVPAGNRHMIGGNTIEFTTGAAGQPAQLVGSALVTDVVAPGAVAQFIAAKACAYVSAVNYNNPNSHYTLKFKRLAGALPANVSDIQAQNITGFLPSTGNNETAGGFANVYVRTAGQNYLVEGVMTDGSFIDQTTYVDWQIATMQRQVLTMYLQNKVVPYDATGAAMLYSAIDSALSAGEQSGALTDQRTNEEGELLPAYEINIQDLATVDQALQAQRIAPVATWCARYAGAFHYDDVFGELKLAK